jgi:hypothetical protein
MKLNLAKQVRISKAAAPPTPHAPPLRSVDQLPLPVGQWVSVPDHSQASFVGAASRGVAVERFTIVESSLAQGADRAALGRASGSLVAERNIRRAETSVPMRMSMVVLLAAGVALGALDAYVVGTVILATPWVGTGGAIALYMWFRFGRSYESEVVTVAILAPAAVSDARPGTDSTKEPTRLLWTAGRVRSVNFDGVRTAVEVVDCPVSLMEAIGRMIRRFESDVS